MLLRRRFSRLTLLCIALGAALLVGCAYMLSAWAQLSGELNEKRLCEKFVWETELKHAQEQNMLRERIGALDEEVYTLKSTLERERAQHSSKGSQDDQSLSLAQSSTTNVISSTTDSQHSYAELVVSHWDAFTDKREFVPLHASPVDGLKFKSKQELDAVRLFASDWLATLKDNEIARLSSGKDPVPLTPVFKRGWRKLDRVQGTDYILDFEMLPSSASAAALQQVQQTQQQQQQQIIRCVVSKPCGPTLVLQKASLFTLPAPLGIASDPEIPTAAHAQNLNTIVLVVPVAGRHAQLRAFLARFVAMTSMGHNLGLVLVNFRNHSENDPHQLQASIRAYKLHLSPGFKLVDVDEPFSRSVGLSRGAAAVHETAFNNPDPFQPPYMSELFDGSSSPDKRPARHDTAQSLPERDALMFFCDLDVDFTPDFFAECRQGAVRGSQVYSPILFSLFKDQEPKVSPDAGLWRSFGFGMMCLYKSDFRAIGGFGDKVYPGWGSEDVDLVDRFLGAGYRVFRATSTSLFHLWHAKVCDERVLPEKALRACRQTQLLHMGSTRTLAAQVLEYSQRVAQLERKLLQSG